MAPAHLAVRPANAPDLEAVAALFDAYRQFYGQAPDREAARRFIGQRLAAADALILVAPDAQDGPLRGFCQLYPSFCSIEARPIAILSDLYVAPAARRTGTGAALLQACARQARTRGWVRLELTTAHTNLPAQRLYEAQGWSRETVYRTYTLAVPA